jgi:hypothetical protein
VAFIVITLVILANGVLTYRIACLNGTSHPDATWHWGLTSDPVAGTCDNQILFQYLVIQIWPVVVLAALVLVVLLRRHRRSGPNNTRSRLAR